MVNIFAMNGPEKGREFQFNDDVISLGRSPDNHLCLSDKSVSRNHLVIIQRGNQCYFKDMKSTNGSFIDGKAMVPGVEYPVGEGVPIRLGNIIVSLGIPLDETSVSGEDSVTFKEETEDTGQFNRIGTSPKNLEVIYNVSSALMESLDINAILEKVLHAIFELLKRIDRGAIILIDSNTGEISKVISKSSNSKLDEQKAFSQSIVERVVHERKPLSFMDTLDEKGVDLSGSMIAMKIRSVMCVPLISRSQMRGVIYVDSINKASGFRKEDLSLLTALSGPAAIAIENAMLYSTAEKLVEERTRSLKEAEKKLRESETRFKAIFDNMNSGVGVYKAIDNGQDFVILDLNRSNQRIERVNRKMTLGQPVTHVFPEIERNGLLDVFKRVWADGKPEHISISFEGGKEKPSRREYDVYRLPSKEIVAIFDDVTEKKRVEEEQKDLQKQLLVSQKMESIGAFAGGTAHNFRNILQAISGNIEYLEVLYGEKHDIKEVAKNIYDSVEKGVDLINNLLHFSRRGEGYQVCDTDLGEIISKSCEIIEKVFDKNIEIHCKLDNGLYVSGNQSLLSQVFMNLFTNARDAMPNGGTLHVETKKQKGKVIAIVSDTGHGMDQETMEKIFDPFFTLKDVGKGTGLGLSTTHGIIEEHKGIISVSSKPGKGTTFKIALPSIEPVFLEKEERRKDLVHGTGQRVLIVDDEKPTLEALTQLTATLGYKVFSFNRPLEALRNYQKVSPDVVLMDRSMPEMDGVACINEIMKADQKARVIIVSGYEGSGPDGIDEHVKTKIKGYLTKPCGIEELSFMLHQALEG